MILKDGNRHRELVSKVCIATFTRRSQENSKHGGEKDITTLIGDGSDFQHGSVEILLDLDKRTRTVVFCPITLSDAIKDDISRDLTLCRLYHPWHGGERTWTS